MTKAPHSEPFATSTEEGFGLMLETACEDRLTSFRQVRAAGRVRMALAKSFVVHAVRARRICDKDAGSLGLDRLERTQFLKATQTLVSVRDVNEHGFKFNADSKPSMHPQEGGGLGDETSMMITSPEKILMGPVNLHTVYVAVDRTRKLAGFSALYTKAKQTS